MTTAVICIAILSTLVLGLGMNVSRLRGMRQKEGGQQFPTDASDSLFKAVRAHGNAAEYVTTLAVLMLVIGSSPSTSSTWTAFVMAGATASRLLHAVAVFISPSLERQTVLRLVGAMGTYVLGLALVVAAVLTVR